MIEEERVSVSVTELMVSVRLCSSFSHICHPDKSSHPPFFTFFLERVTRGFLGSSYILTPVAWQDQP